MKIIIVSGFYSEGMGYSENSLSKFLARLGHDVHVVASDMNVYGNTPDYATTYERFLGPAKMPLTVATNGDGVTVHRLPSQLIGHHVHIRGVLSKVASLAPDIVHVMEIASIPMFVLAAAKPFFRFKLFAETHQHMSVLNPVLGDRGPSLRKLAYWLTRTLPAGLASRAIEKCYAIAPDCAEVAERYYGVPREKIAMQHLGSDTARFHPIQSQSDRSDSDALRQELGFAPDDIVAVYTGRFSGAKNPSLLAQAIRILRSRGQPFGGLFIGAGPQQPEIEAVQGCVVRPFMSHSDLARHYRTCDLAVWPSQESMSMLDAAATALPLVVGDAMGEPERVEGSGRMFREGDATALADVLEQLRPRQVRAELGEAGRQKMERGFSWEGVARKVAADFEAALGRAPSGV